MHTLSESTMLSPADGGAHRAPDAGRDSSRIASLEQPDAALVRRLRARDPLALAELYDRIGAPVYHLALRLVREVPAAEDIVQETFLAVWTRIGTFDAARGRLHYWVLAVARNQALSYLRSQQRCSASRSIPLDEAMGPMTHPDVAAVERRSILEGPWKNLKSHERQTLLLAHWAGLPQAEIARLLDKPLGTVKTWMRGAYQSMRTAIEGQNAG